MFKRYAVATGIQPIKSLPDGKLTAFASESAPVTFEYDPQNFVYFRCRAITADEPNGNGDLFPVDQLREAYPSFIGVGLYKDHDSDSIDKAIGKVLHADWVSSQNYVECICAVDRQLAPDLARRVESGIATSVSMGCSVREAECGIPECGNIAHNPQDLCTHMMPGLGSKGQKGPDGKTVYEINRGLQFTELSLVTVPADPTARIFEIYASLDRKASLQRGPSKSDLHATASLFEFYCKMRDAGFSNQAVANIVTGRSSLNKSSAPHVSRLIRRVAGEQEDWDEYNQSIADQEAAAAEQQRQYQEQIEQNKQDQAAAEKQKQQEQAAADQQERYIAEDQQEAQGWDVSREVAQGVSEGFDDISEDAAEDQARDKQYEGAEKEQAQTEAIGEEARRTVHDVDPVENYGAPMEWMKKKFHEGKDAWDKTPGIGERWENFKEWAGNPEYGMPRKFDPAKVEEQLGQYQEKASDMMSGASTDEEKEKVLQSPEYQFAMEQMQNLEDQAGSHQAEQYAAEQDEKASEKDRTYWNVVDYARKYQEYGPDKIRQELSGKGISKSVIDQALNEQAPGPTPEFDTERAKVQPGERVTPTAPPPAPAPQQEQPAHRAEKSAPAAPAAKPEPRVPRRVQENAEKLKEGGGQALPHAAAPDPAKTEDLRQRLESGEMTSEESVGKAVERQKEEQEAKEQTAIEDLPFKQMDKIIKDKAHPRHQEYLEHQDTIDPVYLKWKEIQKEKEPTKRQVERKDVKDAKETEEMMGGKAEDAKNPSKKAESSLSVIKNLMSRRVAGSTSDKVSMIKNLMSTASKDAPISRIASKVVEKKHNLTEKQMGLSIEYQKGPTLTQSFFVAQDGNSNYRCAASDVLPLIVQDRIASDDPGVATPEQIVSDLQSKYSSVSDIKKWAKRRRKKNRQAAIKKEELTKTAMDMDKEPSKDSKPDASKDSAAKKLEDKLKSFAPKDKSEKAPADKPADKPSDKGRDMMSDKKEASAKDDKSTAILSALENLTAFVKVKMDKESAKIESIQAPIDAGVKGNDASAGSGEFKPPTSMETTTEKTPQHSDELTSHTGEKVDGGSGKLVTENAKVPMDKGAAREDAIKKEAIDQGWSMNNKELESDAKVPAPKQAQPDVMSWDEKEAKSEAVSTKASGDSAAKVKKYYQGYKGKGPGEAPVAMDLKSSLGEEVRMLRKALDSEKAEKEKLVEKDRLQNVADSIYEIVSELREKRVIKAGKEDKVIDLLTTKFASAEQLDGVKGLVQFISKNAGAVAEEQEVDAKESLEVGNVVPQTFETVENTEDAISELSRIWNL